MTLIEVVQIILLKVILQNDNQEADSLRGSGQDAAFCINNL